MLDRPTVYVHLLPSLIPPAALKGGIAVVVDVLRATTMIVYALAAGCEAVIACGEVDAARYVAANLPKGTALLGGERGGLPIEGFDLGNSPSACTPEICKGKTLVITTTNGTRAILTSLEAERVVIGSFPNLGATSELLYLNLLKAHKRPVHIVCAGTEGFISYEDTLLAGALVSELQDIAKYGNDEALLAASCWSDGKRRLADQTLDSLLMQGRGGRNVISRASKDDILDAAQQDRFDLTAELRQRTPARIIATRYLTS